MNQIKTDKPDKNRQKQIKTDEKGQEQIKIGGQNSANKIQPTNILPRISDKKIPDKNNVGQQNWTHL